MSCSSTRSPPVDVHAIQVLTSARISRAGAAGRPSRVAILKKKS